MKKLLFILFAIPGFINTYTDDLHIEVNNEEMTASSAEDDDLSRGCCKTKEICRLCVKTLSVSDLLVSNGQTILNGPTTVNNSFSVNGNSTFNDPVTINSSLTVNGTVTINGSPIINGITQYASFTDQATGGAVGAFSPVPFDTTVVSTPGITLGAGGDITLANTGVYQAFWTVNITGGGAGSSVILAAFLSPGGFSPVFATDNTDAVTAVGQAILTVTVPGTVLTVENRNVSPFTLNLANVQGIYASITVVKIA